MKLRTFSCVSKIIEKSDVENMAAAPNYSFWGFCVRITQGLFSSARMASSILAFLITKPSMSMTSVWTVFLTVLRGNWTTETDIFAACTRPVQADSKLDAEQRPS
jgi:hypothetical protein